jgi:hypothetical protein
MNSCGSAEYSAQVPRIRGRTAPRPRGRAAHLLGLGRRLKIALWVWFALTATAAVHFGWHYVLDDLAGIAMGAVALGLARLLSGIDFGALRRGRVAAAVRRRTGLERRPASPGRRAGARLEDGHRPAALARRVSRF